MKRTPWPLVAALAAALVGCGENETTDDAAASPAPAASPAAPAADDPQAAAPVVLSEEQVAEIKKANEAVVLTADELAAIEELPAEDRELALAQKVCPVQDTHLGSMGVPVKLTAGEVVGFVCCKGCKTEFEADPAATLAKMKAPKSE